MGAGVPSGLQNQFGELRASWVGSIPTYSRHFIVNRRVIILDNKKELLRQLPKIDEVLKDRRLSAFLEETPRPLLAGAVKDAVCSLREAILKGEVESVSQVDYERAVGLAMEILKDRRQPGLRPVINATGVILHTNLGRARLPEEAARWAYMAARNYSTLEYDLKKGQRGSRTAYVEELLCNLTGAESATVVNNNAAGVLIALTELAREKEVLVSRGELVEIGGSFRIPEIMELGGARLREVGTTNKTVLSDYEKAMGESTGMLLKVHTSNYRILGFTAETSLGELAQLGKKAKLPVVYDMGGGLLQNMERFGLREPGVSDAIKAGADLVLFSGDKLLGGPQAGILAGKKAYVDRIRKHPLARALRPDKMTLAALEALLRIYGDPEAAVREIPVLAMIAAPREELLARARHFADLVKGKTSRFHLEVVEVTGEIGGGTAPLLPLKSWGVAVSAEGVSPDRLEKQLRRGDPPVIARIYRDRLLLDMRTIESHETEVAAEVLTSCLSNGKGGEGHGE